MSVSGNVTVNRKEGQIRKKLELFDFVLVLAQTILGSLIGIAVSVSIKDCQMSSICLLNVIP